MPASATLTCTVFDSRTNNPIGRSSVRVGGAPLERPTFDGSHTVTRVPSGQHAVDIGGQGYRTISMTLDFTAGQAVTTEFYLDPDQPGPPPRRT